MSKNSVPSSNDPRKITSQRLSQGPPPALANTGNPRPPVFFVTSDLKNVLNYSFQTGEEFALEFIQDRANTRKTSVLTISEDPGVHATGEKPREKMMSHPAFADISGQGSSKSFAAESYDIAPAKMKFLCNFGGRFLPRPGDGQLRYVGGERHLLWISKDMSWQELTEKTAGLYRRAHAIKYHLPGENVNVLISVASDEDLHHMIDECGVLHATEEKPAMYLVSLDDDGEHHVHYVVESTDADVEAQFIAAVNGFAGSGEALSAFRSASANDIDTDHLMFGMEDDVSSSMKSEPSLGGAAMPSRTSSRVPSGARPGRASSVPSEFTCPDKREQRGKTATKPQTAGLQWTNTNVIERVQRGGILRTQERSGASRRELPISLDDSGSKQQFPSPTSRLGDSPGARAGRVEKAGPLIQLSQPDDSTGFQKLEPHNMSEGLLVNPPDSKILVIQAGCASVSDGSEKPVYRHLRSDDTMMMKPRRYCSQEVAATDQISKQQHDKMQMADPSHLTDCNDSGGLAPWHDDMFLEPAVESVTDSSQQTGSDGEIVHSPHPLTSSDSNATSLRNGEKKSSSSIAKEDAERSESPGNDANSPRARNQSQEAKKNIAPPIPKLKSTDSSKSANEALGRELVKSNVQIINNEDLEDLRELGAGAFGTVFHGRWKGTDVAIKRIKNSCFTYPSSQADKLISEFWREADIISKLHHPNVLAFYGVVNNGPGGTLATVTEFMVSGSLKKVLLRKDRYLDRRKRLMLAMDVAIGMEYLHTKSIIHFDLKCDNLLVNLKDLSRPICKVADFGLSKMKQTTMVSGGMRGTLPWMAPELLTMGSNKVSEKVDLYSFGIVMWEILTGEEPYAGMHYGEVIGGIMSNKLRPPVPTYCDPEWRKLMEQCWSTEPEQRPTFTEVAIRLRSMLEASQGQPVSLFAMP